jgi:hypothetical protein
MCISCFNSQNQCQELYMVSSKTSDKIEIIQRRIVPQNSLDMEKVCYIYALSVGRARVTETEVLSDHCLASCKPANANLSRLKERNQTHVVLQISRDISFSLLACCMCCRCLICKDGCWVHRSNNKHMEYVLISCPLANSSCKQLCQ